MLNNGFHGKTPLSARDANGPKNAPQSPTTRRSPHGTADDCHRASCQHYERTHRSGASLAQVERPRPLDVAGGGNSGGPPSFDPRPIRGDLIYGAAAIAAFLFDGESGKKARRRVYNLWVFHRDRNDPAGFLKMKGALVLSISQHR